MVHQHFQPVLLVKLQAPDAGREHRDGCDVFLRDQPSCRVKEVDNEPMCWLMVAWQLPVDMKHIFLFYRPAFDYRFDCGLCKQKVSKISRHSSCETFQGLCCAGSWSGSGSRTWRLTKAVSHHDGFGTLAALPTSPWPAQLCLDDVGSDWPEVHEGNVLAVVNCWSRKYVKTMPISTAGPATGILLSITTGGLVWRHLPNPDLTLPHTDSICVPQPCRHTHNG